MTLINPIKSIARSLSMKAKITLPLILLLGFGGFFLHYRSEQIRKEISDDSKTTNPKSELETTVESLPEIDFPFLGQARPIDLIDLALEFPESLKKLDGQRVSMIGFMAPFDSLEDMRRCQIVPSYVGCTFCNPPNLRQVVYVTQGNDDNSNETYSFIEEPSHVTGIFRISLPGSYHEGKKKGFVYSIEQAEVTAYLGDAPKRAPSHANPDGHNSGMGAAPLTPVVPEVLFREVTKFIGIEPIHPISVERVTTKSFVSLIREKLISDYPLESRIAKAKAFSLLGLAPSGGDWIDILGGFELGQRIALADENGRRVFVLDSVSLDHPYVRLDLVKNLADAFIRQNIANSHEERKEVLEENDDSRRAKEALRLGIAKTVSRRYARSMSISPKVQPPLEFVTQRKTIGKGSLLDLWYSLPTDVGPFFVNFLAGSHGPLVGIESALNRPPTSLMEFLRPLWYEDPSLWKQNPVPKDFADEFMQTPPDQTGVLGIGGLIPWLAHKNSSYTARNISGQWAGDRWAVWEFPDGSTALLLETRWQDEESALKFRDAIPEHPYQWHFPYESASTTIRLLRGTSTEAINRQDPFAQ
tara:strand:+ start:3206 stop:4963 length:1758 start_codon:yes stop_codon:yes gene_type:complete